MMIRESGMSHKAFFTSERFAQEQAKRAESSRGRLLVASCRSGSYLSTRVVKRYRDLLAEEGSETEILYLESVDDQFSDSETCVRLDLDVSGHLKKLLKRS